MYRANRFALRLANGVGHLDFLVVGGGEWKGEGGRKRQMVGRYLDRVA